QDLYLEFSREFSFHKESLEATSNISYLRSVVEDYFDEIDELRIIYSENVGTDPLEDDQSANDLLDEKSELVKEKFGGNVIEEGRL
ncbi:hypothetical protein KGY71_06135, partial [Candidatus Bipolaricaulota bacterium]|nr:hypothetical protein [Candidatus Bipolaricaulota bacterium]